MTLAPLIKREIKAFIKNPGFIISLVLIVAIYGVIGGVASKTSETVAKEVAETGIGIVFEENTELVVTLASLLNKTFNGRIYTCSSAQEAVSRHGIAVIIPKGFTENATSTQRPITIKAFAKLTSLSTVGGQSRLNMLSSISNTLERLLPIAITATYKTYNASTPPLKPVAMNTTVMLFNKVINYEAYSALTSVAVLIPFFISMILGINAGTATQLVAVEKAEKAFEMLLSQPIKRRDIVIAKIVGASVSSLLFGAIYILSLFFSMMGSSSQAPSTQSALQMIFDTVARTVGSEIYVMMAISIVLGLILSGSLGVLIGSVVSDERIAGGLATPVILFFMGVGFVAMFIGLTPSISTAVLSGLTVALIPYAYTLFALSGDATLTILSIVTAIAVCSILIYMAVAIFDRDVVILGLRVSWRRREEKKW